MSAEKERKDTQKALLYDLRRLIEKEGRDFTNAELLKFLDMIADAKDQERSQPPVLKTGGLFAYVWIRPVCQGTQGSGLQSCSQFSGSRFPSCLPVPSMV